MARKLYVWVRHNRGVLTFVLVMHLLFIAMSVFGDGSIGIRGALGLTACYMALGMYMRAQFLHGDSHYLPVEVRVMSAPPDRASDIMASTLGLDLLMIIAISLI